MKWWVLLVVLFLVGSVSAASNINTSGTIDASAYYQSGSATLSNSISGSAADLACTNCIGGTEIDESTLSGTATSLIAGDLSCTDCLSTTEISDVYLLNNGDSATGQYTFSSTANPGITIGDATTGYLKIGGSTISDAAGDLTLDSDSTKTVVSDDLQVSGNDLIDSTATTRLTLGSTTTISGSFAVSGGTASSPTPIQITAPSGLAGNPTSSGSSVNIVAGSGGFGGSAVTPREAGNVSLLAGDGGGDDSSAFSAVGGSVLIDAGVGGYDPIGGGSANGTILLGARTKGLVGIGLKEPHYRLQVQDSSTKALNVSDTLYVDGSAKTVGIGTSSPHRKLEVVGAANVTGALYTGTIYTSSSAVEVTSLASGDRNAYVDLHGDDTYSDYGVRLIRYAGANSNSELLHRGTGNLSIEAIEGGNLKLYTSSLQRATITAAGNLGLGIDAPKGLFHAYEGTETNGPPFIFNYNVNTGGLEGTMLINYSDSSWGSSQDDTNILEILSSGSIVSGCTDCTQLDLVHTGTIGDSSFNALSVRTSEGGTVNGAIRHNGDAFFTNLSLGSSTHPGTMLFVGNSPATNTNNGRLLIVQDTAPIGSSANSMVYPAEFKYSDGNQIRLLFSGYQRHAQTSAGWANSSWRIQTAVDNSFTAYNAVKGYVEFENRNSAGWFHIGTEGADRINVDSSGNVGIAADTPTTTLDVNGLIRVRNPSGDTVAPTRSNNGEFAFADVGAGVTNKRLYYRVNGANYYIGSDGTGDFSEYFLKQDPAETIPNGSVVTLYEGVGPSSSIGSQVLGVVSTNGTRNNDDGHDGMRHKDPRYVNVGLLGHVPVRVNLEGGPISVGDLLMASSTPGVAMRYDPSLVDSDSIGVIGTALESHESGEGEILAFVSPETVANPLSIERLRAENEAIKARLDALEAR